MGAEDSEELRGLMRDAPEIWERIYMPTTEGDLKLRQAAEPHFTQPQLYKHSFKCMYSQFESLHQLDVKGRFGLLREWIESAMANYEDIRSMPMSIEKHGSGVHLQPWLDTINYYYRNH